MHLKVFFRIFLAMFFILGFDDALASDLPQEYRGKIQAALGIWEYEQQEFLRLTKLNENQKQVLINLFNRERDGKIRRGIALLLALNCAGINSEFYSFTALESYRCKNGSFEVVAGRSLVSFEDIYVLAFVKKKDRHRTISFLKRYIRFWKDERNNKDGMGVGESDKEYLEEILSFLEKGGYP